MMKNDRGKVDSGQVFYKTSLCFCLCNIKPLLPGHTLVIPLRKVSRFTDLTPEETSDIFSTVQKVQRMLSHVYFNPDGRPLEAAIINDLSKLPSKGGPTDGSFNIALQDGPDAGQSVFHVHVHVIPRQKGNELGDGIYDELASDAGNVGGQQFDVLKRPVGGSQTPKVEDVDRKARSKDEMDAEAAFYREQMALMGFS